MVLVFRDVSERRRVERQRAARLAVTQILTESATLWPALLTEPATLEPAPLTELPALLVAECVVPMTDSLADEAEPMIFSFTPTTASFVASTLRSTTFDGVTFSTSTSRS